jgi:glycosyltransferase involved in cell wall biosynthesis
MACGVPIICSDLPVLHEVAGECAVYFDPNKVEDISQAINQISSDENLAKQLSVAGLTRVKRFSWTKCAKESFDYIIN